MSGFIPRFYAASKIVIPCLAYANWLRSDATDRFNQYHELPTELANQYFNSVPHEY